MNIAIQAIKFSVADKLTAYIEKKVGKLDKFYNAITDAEVVLKVVKPETAENKEVQITLLGSNVKLFASKQADSFEQAVSECVIALEKQIKKLANK
ncbi:MAG: ribosome-associated translation inhibitor RaiA [Prevotellaceae bacterium]|jgi:putative sigma-54 modulation protein|nr:ribosome-associated translation inhibitor RaiA [Prevotellaceae bacterium]